MVTAKDHVQTPIFFVAAMCHMRCCDLEMVLIDGKFMQGT